MRRLLNVSIKVAILLLLVWAIYKQVFRQEDFSFAEYWDEFVANLYGANYLWLGLVLLLMPLNWGLETLKWRMLVRKLEDISFWKAYKGVLCGVTLAVFTPNRVGEYGGRILVLEPEDRLRAIAVTLIGSYGQVIVTIVAGIIAFLYYMVTFLDFDLYVQYAIAFLGGLVILFAVVTYFNISLLSALVKMFPLLRRIDKYLHMFSEYSIRELFTVLGYSVFRYAVFTIQYMLLLKLFGLQFSFFLGGALVSLVFFTQTVLPSIALFELGIRGSIAIYFFQIISQNVFGIISAAFSLWMINLMLPAIAGAFLVFRINFIKKKSE